MCADPRAGGNETPPSIIQYTFRLEAILPNKRAICGLASRTRTVSVQSRVNLQTVTPNNTWRVPIIPKAGRLMLVRRKLIMV